MPTSIYPSPIPSSCPQHLISVADLRLELFAQYVLQRVPSDFPSLAVAFISMPLDLHKYLIERITWLCIQIGAFVTLEARYGTFHPIIKNTRWGMKTIEMVRPREESGRDTISRFDMQFQAAAYAALEILKGTGVDCVYCDHHDDFVVRRTIGERVTYHFFQVKTKKKENHQWSFTEVFSMAKQRPKRDDASLAKIKASIAGKLLIHGIIFTESCAEVTLLSNVHFDDDVINVVDELQGKAPASTAAKFLAENFSAIFSIEEAGEINAAEALSKMSLLPSVRHIGDDREIFASAARSAVLKYSEIDLTFNETKELAAVAQTSLMLFICQPSPKFAFEGLSNAS